MTIDNCVGGTAASHDSCSSIAAKSIGMLGSMAIAVNSLAGPAVLQLPATYQEAGIIPTTIALVVVGLLSSFCSLHMANVVSKVPGNRSFDKEVSQIHDFLTCGIQCTHSLEPKVEFSEPFRVFWGRRAFVVTQILFFLCTVCLNIAAIVDTAEVVDTFFGHSPFGSAGLRFDNFDPKFVHWKHGPCSRKEVKNGLCIAFGDASYGNFLLTAGYFVAAAVFLPVCLMDLKENSAFQIFGFFVLLLISLQFVISFCMYGLKFHHTPVWGVNYGKMLGVIIFNFSLVVAVPAWLHEKKRKVSTSKGKKEYDRLIMSLKSTLLTASLSSSCIWFNFDHNDFVRVSRLGWSSRYPKCKSKPLGTLGVRSFWHSPENRCIILCFHHHWP
jgi:Transmembrane amino acid transporter protein